MGAGLHLYQMTCWENVGRWYCNDIKNTTGRSAKWYTPMRILDLPVEEYISLLVNTFNAKKFYYCAHTNYLTFSFATEKEAKAFCSYVNKIARQKNYNCQ